MQREGINQAINIPCGFSVFFEEFPHQDFLGLNIGLTGDNRTPKFFADILYIVNSRICHWKIIFHTEQYRIHMHNFLQHPHLKMAVFSTRSSHCAVISSWAIHPPVFITEFFKFRKTFIPINLPPLFIMPAGTANSLCIKCDSRTGIWHCTTLTVTHRHFLLFFCTLYFCCSSF